MTHEELAAIEARAAAATPGNWEVVSDGHTAIVCCERDLQDNRQVGSIARIRSGPEYQDLWPNAAFIAHARQDVPALCAALREARAEVEAWKLKAAAYKEAMESWRDEKHDSTCDPCQNARDEVERLKYANESLNMQLQDRIKLEHDHNAYVKCAKDKVKWVQKCASQSRKLAEAKALLCQWMVPSTDSLYDGGMAVATTRAWLEANDK